MVVFVIGISDLGVQEAVEPIEQCLEDEETNHDLDETLTSTWNVVNVFQNISFILKNMSEHEI